MQMVWLLLWGGYLAPAALAQKHPLQWGQVPANHWAMTRCPIDSGAYAMVLADYGTVEVVSGFEYMILRRHIRLKILNKKALPYATTSIGYYSGQGIERIISVRAQTLNRRADGTIEAKKVKQADIFDLKLSRYTGERKFTFPAVAEGSIIEYKYTVQIKNLLFLKTWDFQGPLPALHSELRLQVPPGMEYTAIVQGNRLAAKYSEGQHKQWVLTDVPALVSEPWAPPQQNYSERLRFQLKRYPEPVFLHGKQAMTKRIMLSWPELANELTNNLNYQRYLANKQLAANLLLRMPTDLQGLAKLKWVYRAVQANFQWNEAYSIFTEQPLHQMLATRQGNSAEMNLLLCLLLKKAGFKAVPAIASTRQNGSVVGQYPLLNQFNHLVAYVEHKGNELLLDATNPYLPYYLPNPPLLGDSVLVMQGDSTGWLPTTQPPETCHTTYATVRLGADGNAIYDMTLKTEGFLAVELYNLLNENLVALHHVVAPALQADEDARLTFEVLRKNGLVVLANVRLNAAQGHVGGQSLLIQPWLPLTGYMANPFIKKDRALPIQWPYPATYHYQVAIEPPKGYIPTTTSDSLQVVLPHNYGSYRYSLQWNGQQLVMTVRYQLNGLGLPTKYYPQWRSFYETLTTRFAETVAFKLAEAPAGSQRQR